MNSINRQHNFIMNVIKFSADWCGPCKAMAPIFEKASKQYPNIKFIDSDVEDNPELAEKYHIRNVPTFIVTGKNNEEIVRRSGSMTFDQLCKMVETAAA